MLALGSALGRCFAVEAAGALPVISVVLRSDL